MKEISVNEALRIGKKKASLRLITDMDIDASILEDIVDVFVRRWN